MAKDRSFTSYIADRFDNELFDAIKFFLEDNSKSLNIWHPAINSIGGIELADIWVKYISVNDLPGTEISFEVAVEAELEVRESDYRYDNTAECNQWFMITCKGDLDCNLNDFQVLDTKVYNGKNKQAKPMSDALVPIISMEKMEETANQFLKENYPKALLQPMAIDSIELATNMGLQVEMRHITKDCTVFGQIYFEDCKAEFYDKKTDTLIEEDVTARTIFVDPKTYFLYNLGKVNNTIVHECVHWDRHRKAFELERLYNSEANRIKCQTVGGVVGSSKDATEWMEWQANALAPRIQMPLTMFKNQASKFIREMREKTGKFDIIDIIEPVIDSLATFFCVSRTAAKIRMVDAGYEEAIGAFIYIDGRYVMPHQFKKSSIRENQTFTLSAEEAAIQVITNPNLVELVQDGIYQYVDAHMVLNHPKYLKLDMWGHTCLTDYARNHMDECCLVFDMSIKSNDNKDYHSVCYLNKDKDSTISFDIKFGDGYAFAEPEKRRQLLEETLMEEGRIYNSLPNNFVGAMQVIWEWRNESYTELADRVHVDKQTISRIVNGARDPSINTLVLICLGLHLPPLISKYLIEKSPCSLNYSNSNHLWYEFALTNLSKQSMESIEQFFHNHNVQI